jgi:hypothetical protein
MWISIFNFCRGDRPKHCYTKIFKLNVIIVIKSSKHALTNLHIIVNEYMFDNDGGLNNSDKTKSTSVNMLASSAVDRGFEPRSGQIKDYILVFVAFPLSTQH